MWKTHDRSISWTCLLRNGIIYLPSLASPIVAFNTSSWKQSSNLRKDEASYSRQSSLVTKFFLVLQGGSWNLFWWLLSMLFSRFSTPCDDNSTTREIQLHNIFVSGEKWHEPQSHSLITLGLYSNHVIMDTAGPQKVSVLTRRPH